MADPGFATVARLRASSLLAAAGILASCAPSVTLPGRADVQATGWSVETPAGAAGAAFPASLAAGFASPELEALVARALSANADLGVAAARVEQARAQLAIARASMFPIVSATGGISRSRSSGSGNDPSDTREATARVEAQWEVDLFGRLKAERRAARSRLHGAEFDREALALVVEADVAGAWVQYAALGDRLALLDRSIASARELDRILGVRLRLGESTRVDTGLQRIELRRLEAERHRLEEARTRTRNALALLLGEEAPTLALPPATLRSLVVPAFAPEPPAMLLVRRPDLRAAEARIAAANGDVAVARAAFLPRLTLSAAALGQAATVGGPIGTTLSAGADILAPIFDRARLQGGLDYATASQRESVELYRKALLTALSETEDALAGVARSAERETLLSDAVAEARTTARLARLQYLEGEADLQVVLDAEGGLVDAEDARAVALQERLQAAVDLYRALGGGARHGS